jgi:hypothetical protein
MHRTYPVSVLKTLEPALVSLLRRATLPGIFLFDLAPFPLDLALVVFLPLVVLLLLPSMTSTVAASSSSQGSRAGEFEGMLEVATVEESTLRIPRWVSEHARGASTCEWALSKSSQLMFTLAQASKAAGRELSPLAPATPACMIGVVAGKDTCLEFWPRVRDDMLRSFSPGVVSASPELGSTVCGRRCVGRNDVLRGRRTVLGSGMLIVLRGEREASGE